ncbi:hypothetical protein [Alicyclobacillus mali (ex Roth et al. 2021)]|uniref:hypothetical protein n=1 Tax=Alicyclobacillus mali (ex Roth et al. 2021) TaxID=1123961 RepID=UPI001E48B90A|nr:hypothetical protein [Alicyclobacillus mali (ex Roth et al. 2021)]
MSQTWIRLRRGLGIVIPAIALSVSAYWSLALHWQACVMCWSERLLLAATLFGWAIDLPWLVAFASASGLVVSALQMVDAASSSPCGFLLHDGAM